MNKHIKVPSLISNFVSAFLTFNFVAILWVLFRASSFSSAFDSLTQIWSDFHINNLYSFFLARKEVIYMLFISVIIIFSNLLKLKLKSIFVNLPIYVIVLIFLFVLQLILEIKDQEIQPFIYFQF